MKNTMSEKSQLFWGSMSKVAEMKKYIVVLLFSLFMLSLSSCTVVKKIDNLNGIMDKTSDPEIGRLMEAEYAFLSGNYPLAKEIYTEVQKETQKERFKNTALYGLASIRIATAKNTEELKKGFIMLKDWKEPNTDVIGFEENPKIIAEALNKNIGLLKCKPIIRYVTTKEKAAAEKESKQEIQELKNTIKKLQHQISVLEAIDQEIQEKMKP